MSTKKNKCTFETISTLRNYYPESGEIGGFGQGEASYGRNGDGFELIQWIITRQDYNTGEWYGELTLCYEGDHRDLDNPNHCGVGNGLALGKGYGYGFWIPEDYDNCYFVDPLPEYGWWEDE